MYANYLQALLEPLGIYNFETGGIQQAELAALGTELDRISNRLEQAEREGNTATAVDQGLSRREALFLHRPAAATAEDRRAAIAALLQMDGDSLTPSAINLTLRGCGIKAWAQEKGNGCLRVLFPEVAGIPEEFERIRTIILEILPCHLAVEYFYKWFSWRELEALFADWRTLEERGLSWAELELLEVSE